MTEPTDAGGSSPSLGRLIGDLGSLDRAYALGHHGRWSAARRAGIVDWGLSEVFDASDPPDGVALVALGGYGRGALSPGSDVDLLIVHDGATPAAVAELADDLLYPLWNVGLDVGHAVRTPAECVESSGRLDAATAMLDGRLLAGDGSVWERAHAGVLQPILADARGFAARLVHDRGVRRGRFGSVSSLLEPDIKEGVGGLRDVHALG